MTYRSATSSIPLGDLIPGRRYTAQICADRPTALTAWSEPLTFEIKEEQRIADQGYPLRIICKRISNHRLKDQQIKGSRYLFLDSDHRSTNHRSKDHRSTNHADMDQ